MNEQSVPRSNKRLLSALAGVLVVGVAVITVTQFGRSAQADTNAVSTTRAAITVETTVATSVAASERPQGTGTLEASRSVSLAFAVGGVVHKLVAAEGGWLSKGDPLVELDQVPFRSAVDQHAARVRFLEKSLARSEMLLSNQALSPEEFDAQTAELDAAKAQLRLSRWNLERATLRAPFDGRVARRHVERGQVLSAGVPVADMLDTRRLEVWTAVSAREASAIAAGQPVTVRAIDRDDVAIAGVVDHAPVRSDVRSGTVPVLVTLPDEAHGFLAGMVVQCTFTTNRTTARLSLPTRSIRVQNDGNFVMRVVDGRARRVAVQLGAIGEAEVEIVSGIEAGDEVITRAPDRLRDGDAVVVSTTLSAR